MKGDYVTPVKNQVTSDAAERPQSNTTMWTEHQEVGQRHESSLTINVELSEAGLPLEGSPHIYTLIRTN